MNSDQHKEHIVNVIEKLKQQNILIENKLQELSIFYITYKEKYDYDYDYDYDYKLAKTFFDNLKNFIENEIIINSDNFSYLESHVKNYFGDYSDNYSYNTKNFNYSKHYGTFIERYLFSLNSYYSSSYRPDPDTPEKLQVDNNFNFICNYGEERLIFGMLMNDKKLKCYEKLLKLYPEPNCEKPEIKNIMDMNIYTEKPEIVNLIDLLSGV